jgi:hypothetical protein
MRLERIRAQQEKDRQVAEALANFAAMQTGLKAATVTEQVEPKMNTEKKSSGMAEKNKVARVTTTKTGGKTEGKKSHVKVAAKKPHRRGLTVNGTGTG